MTQEIVFECLERTLEHIKSAEHNLLCASVENRDPALKDIIDTLKMVVMRSKILSMQCIEEVKRNVEEK